MNITNEQFSVKETYPENSPLWNCRGLDHDLGGICMENVDAYKKIIDENNDNKVVAAVRVLDIYHTLVTNLASGWDIGPGDVGTILSNYLAWAKEEHKEIRGVLESELRKSCKPTNHGEELADMLMKMT